jgi:hypothetical protein
MPSLFLSEFDIKVRLIEGSPVPIDKLKHTQFKPLVLDVIFHDCKITVPFSKV